ncbi:DUF2007 domain-containing protein [Microbulbifer sp. TYP-18]|uniref:putative signal transducing protein n=1 Tax=Microbulbifer sp. TYP-18 TaxID=3230024 RepID=UPI0034C5ED61
MAQRVFIASDQLMVSHLHNLLEKAGISAITQKKSAHGQGEPDWCTELWVLDDRQFDTAWRLLQEILREEPRDLTPSELVAGLVTMTPDLSTTNMPETSGFPPSADIA